MEDFIQADKARREKERAANAAQSAPDAPIFNVGTKGSRILRLLEAIHHPQCSEQLRNNNMKVLGTEFSISELEAACRALMTRAFSEKYSKFRTILRRIVLKKQAAPSSESEDSEDDSPPPAASPKPEEGIKNFKILC
jgi:hypothetical protein